MPVKTEHETLCNLWILVAGMVGVWVQSPNTWARCTCSIFIQRLQNSPALAHEPFSPPVWAQCHQAYYKKIGLAHLILSFIYFMWPLVCVCLETKTVSQEWNWRSTACSHIFWVAGFCVFLRAVLNFLQRSSVFNVRKGKARATWPYVRQRAGSGQETQSKIHFRCKQSVHFIHYTHFSLHAKLCVKC